MNIKGHALDAWLNHLLFKLLPPEWYLRTQGIELYREPCATATVTYRLHGEVKAAQVEFGSARAIVQMVPLFLKHGFITRPAEDENRYAIPPYDILEIAWYDPVLEDYFSMS